MNRRLLVWLVVLVAGVGVLLACVAILPQYLVALDRAGAAASPDQVLQAKNAARTTLVQAFAGLFLLSGAYITWRQFQSNHAVGQEELRLGRESRLTERLTTAVGQLSSDEPAVRVGGAYALGRLVDESPDDRESIEQILAAYVRTRAQPPEQPARTPLPRLAVRRPEVQAALTVLGRRERAAQPVLYVALDLSGSDLRRAELGSADLRRARLRDCLLCRAGMKGVDLRGADLLRADLTGAVLTGARADLLTWWPDGFDPVAAGVRVDAGLAGADLRGADLRGETKLAEIDLRGALANSYTIWPPGFDRRRAGVRDTDAEAAPSGRGDAVGAPGS